ncbi:MAG: hypothetical protein ACXWYS_08160 [Gaiellaceae bacterium]
MASSSKKKTTMAKMNRETKVRDKRLRKLAKKEARKLEAAEGPVETADTQTAEQDEQDEQVRIAEQNAALARLSG